MAKLGTSLNNSCGVEEQMDEPFLRRQIPGTLPISMHRIRSGLRGSYVLALVIIASSGNITYALLDFPGSPLCGQLGDKTH